MGERHEDPEKLLKQAVQNLICTTEQEMAKVLVNENKLKRKLDMNESAANDWATKAEFAVDAGADDLARRTLRRRQEQEKLAVALRDRVDSAEEVDRTLKHQSNGMTHVLKGHKWRVNSVSLLPFGRFVVSGNDDLTMRFWDVNTEQETVVFKVHTGAVLTVDVDLFVARAVLGGVNPTI